MGKIYRTNNCTKKIHTQLDTNLLNRERDQVGDKDSGIPWNFVWGGGSTNSVEDRGQREQGSGGSSPLVRGSRGSCNLVQEISFHIVKFP